MDLTLVILIRALILALVLGVLVYLVDLIPGLPAPVRLILKIILALVGLLLILRLLGVTLLAVP